MHTQTPQLSSYALWGQIAFHGVVMPAVSAASTTHSVAVRETSSVAVTVYDGLEVTACAAATATNLRPLLHRCVNSLGHPRQAAEWYTTRVRAGMIQSYRLVVSVY